MISKLYFKLQLPTAARVFPSFRVVKLSVFCVLQYRKLLPGGNSSEGDPIGSISRSNAVTSSAKDYVESLHQNSKIILLYGKNNVLVLSVSNACSFKCMVPYFHNQRLICIKMNTMQSMLIRIKFKLNNMLYFSLLQFRQNMTVRSERTNSRIPFSSSLDRDVNS